MSVGALVRLGSDPQGGESKHVVFLTEGKQTFSIGRSPENDIVLDDVSVSREHAHIERRERQFVLFDGGSRNGTRVNGVAVVRRSLRQGDKLVFGNLTFRFSELDSSEDRRPITAVGLEDKEITSSNMTVALPVDIATEEQQSVAVANGWQVLKTFGAFSEHGYSILFQKIVDDICGFRAINRVVVYLLKDVIDSGEHWFKSKPSIQRQLFPNQLKRNIVGVAKSGKAEPSTKRAMPTSTKSLSMPIFIRGASVGTLFVDGVKKLPSSVLFATAGMAEAIGVGLSLRGSAGTMGTVQDNKRDEVDIVGNSTEILACMKLAKKAAAVDSTVLVRGESGTGKDLFAYMIYEESERKQRPFIRVHSSAIEETLLGSTLFGHEKGAFTGAVGMKRGLFEEADGGTIFLDEIGELSMNMQVKLLRVLQEGEFMRIGSNKPIRVDVRVIAATNRDLEAAVEGGTFREDLYYRLKVIDLIVPPLRNRKDDIEELVSHFLGLLGPQVSTKVRKISPVAMEALKKYDWPGNVRELRNVLERSLLMAEGELLNTDDLPSELLEDRYRMQDTVKISIRSDQLTQSPGYDGRLRNVEEKQILLTLAECKGNKKQAAKQLGISRSTLYEKLKNLEMDGDTDDDPASQD